MSIPYLRRQGTATQLLVDDRPFVMLAGELHNSSSSSLAYMADLWPRLTALHLNTVLAPVSWELVEPREDRFDFALVDGLLVGAREHGLKLVLLWFGTYKNAASTYVPEWVKLDQRRFPRSQTEPGRNLCHVSVLCEAAVEADARAFATLLRHLREVDGAQHTVLMIQVENEVGILGGGRDVSPLAQTAFASPVPAELLAYLAEHRATLREEVRLAWEQASACAMSGAWSQVFGVAAPEMFMAWYMARFVGRVAAAGRAEYNLPMYANAWLVQHGGQCAGQYPSGGPVARMLDIWRAGAPALDLLAPDIYLSEFPEVCADYVRGNNPLMIPEARLDQAMAAKAFYAIGEYDALCYAPFAIEDANVGTAGAPASASPGGPLLGLSYRLLRDLMPVVTAWQGTGRMRGVLQTSDAAQALTLGGYRLRVTWTRPYDPAKPPAGGLIISPKDGTFVIAGCSFGVDFLPPVGADGYADFLSLWEGDYRAGQFRPGRRLNGDEYCVRLGASPTVVEARVYRPS